VTCSVGRHAIRLAQQVKEDGCVLVVIALEFLIIGLTLWLKE